MKIQHSIAIKTTLQDFHRAVTTGDGIAAWFTPEVKAGEKAGDTVELSFNHTYTMVYRVESTERPRSVVWAPVQAPEEWKRSRIALEAEKIDGGIEFTFTHSGLPEEYAEAAFFAYCWGQYVRSLKLYLETGKGEPFGSPPSRAWHPLIG